MLVHVHMIHSSIFHCFSWLWCSVMKTRYHFKLQPKLWIRGYYFVSSSQHIEWKVYHSQHNTCFNPVSDAAFSRIYFLCDLDDACENLRYAFNCTDSDSINQSHSCQCYEYVVTTRIKKWIRFFKKITTFLADSMVIRHDILVSTFSRLDCVLVHQILYNFFWRTGVNFTSFQSCWSWLNSINLFHVV